MDLCTDEFAAFSGGVQGNAGLFSTAEDLAKLAQTWLQGGTYGGVEVFRTSTVAQFTERAARMENAPSVSIPPRRGVDSALKGLTDTLDLQGRK